jgi:hypothetical protein
LFGRHVSQIGDGLGAAAGLEPASLPGTGEGLPERRAPVGSGENFSLNANIGAPLNAERSRRSRGTGPTPGPWRA